MTGLNTGNYLPKLRDAAFERFGDYNIIDESSKFSMWTHVRPILSLYLENETGEGLVKGNKPITYTQYRKCLEYLDKILPSLVTEENA